MNVIHHSGLDNTHILSIIYFFGQESDPRINLGPLMSDRKLHGLPLKSRDNWNTSNHDNHTVCHVHA